jgi:hypothetical protein
VSGHLFSPLTDANKHSGFPLLPATLALVADFDLLQKKIATAYVRIGRKGPALAMAHVRIGRIGLAVAYTYLIDGQ